MNWCLVLLFYVKLSPPANYIPRDDSIPSDCQQPNDSNRWIVCVLTERSKVQSLCIVFTHNCIKLSLMQISSDMQEQWFTQLYTCILVTSSFLCPFVFTRTSRFDGDSNVRVILSSSEDNTQSPFHAMAISNETHNQKYVSYSMNTHHHFLKFQLERCAILQKGWIKDNRFVSIFRVLTFGESIETTLGTKFHLRFRLFAQHLDKLTIHKLRIQDCVNKKNADVLHIILFMNLVD